MIIPTFTLSQTAPPEALYTFFANYYYSLEKEIKQDSPFSEK